MASSRTSTMRAMGTFLERRAGLDTTRPAAENQGRRRRMLRGSACRRSALGRGIGTSRGQRSVAALRPAAAAPAWRLVSRRLGGRVDVLCRSGALRPSRAEGNVALCVRRWTAVATMGQSRYRVCLGPGSRVSKTEACHQDWYLPTAFETPAHCHSRTIPQFADNNCSQP